MKSRDILSALYTTITAAEELNERRALSAAWYVINTIYVRLKYFVNSTFKMLALTVQK